MKPTTILAALFLAGFAGATTRFFQRQDDRIQNSNDIAKLERIASADSSEDPENIRLGESGKEHRTAAYIRLGRIGTKESLQAARRVEAKLREVPLLPATVTLGVWPHPMWHFGDSETKPFVTVRTSDGTTYGILGKDLLGDSNDLFLISSKTPDDRTSWTRPILIPNRIYRGFRDPKLEEGKPG